MWRVISAVVMSLLPLAVACGDDGRAPPGGPLVGAGSGGHAGANGSGGVITGACEDGAVRECKVQIDENNCFVGEQVCEMEEWGPCEDPVDPGES
jgi:hypothetical protein